MNRKKSLLGANLKYYLVKVVWFLYAQGYLLLLFTNGKRYHVAGIISIGFPAAG